MPSKGVQAYTYIAVPGCTIELSVPGQTITKTELHQFWNADLEVDAANIKSLFDKSGRFTFRVRHEGRLVTEQWNEINALTGGIDADESTMASIVQTPSVLDRDCIVSYGFYRSGRTGHDLLPARHQCYITVTPPYADWLGRLAPIGSPQRDQPFCRLVLPAAHDVGMNTMANVDVVLRHAGGAVVRTLLQSGGSSNQGVIDDKAAQVLAQLADAVSGPAVAALAPDIVSSLAITQKDSLATMLALGARYFEFRPAFVHAEVRQYLPDKLYFQHSAIPGMAYDDFLNGIVSFLLAHPTEIVVVQLRWDGTWFGISFFFLSHLISHFSPISSPSHLPIAPCINLTNTKGGNLYLCFPFCPPKNRCPRRLPKTHPPTTKRVPRGRPQPGRPPHGPHRRRHPRRPAHPNDWRPPPRPQTPPHARQRRQRLHLHGRRQRHVDGGLDCPRVRGRAAPGLLPW